MSGRRAVTLSLLIFAGVLPARAQLRPANPTRNQRIYSISGTVRDDNGRTIENVRVDLQDGTGTPLNSAYTRGNGEFEFDSLGNGDYSVSAEVKDFEPAHAHATINNSSATQINLDLQRGVTLGQAKHVGTVSVHQLSVPQKARDEYDKGMMLLYGKMDFTGAITQFQHATRDCPTYYEAYDQEGIAEFQMGNTAAAEVSLRKSIEVSGGHYSEAIFALAGMLNNIDRYTDAETVSRQAVELDSSSWQGHLELARALLGLKNPADAEKSALQARDLKPDNPEVFLILANIHIELAKASALIEDLSSYLKLVPSGPQADQARKTRDQLQATIQKAQEQPPQTRTQQ